MTTRNRNEEQMIQIAPAKSVRYRIDKMDCPTEEQLIRKRLALMPGVSRLEFNLLERVLTVHHSLADTSAIEVALRGIGMVPTEINSGLTGSQERAKPFYQERFLLILGGLAALGAEITAWRLGSETTWPVAVLSFFSIITAGLPTLRKGWTALRTFTLNINFLMSIAVVGAVIIRKWPEAAMVTFLFALAEAIEQLSLENARNAIRSLAAIVPDIAEVKTNGEWKSVPVAEVSLGSVVRLRAGERIPLDSRLIDGAISVNEAPITGESMPVDKKIEDRLFAGSVVLDGTGEASVTAVAGESTIARIANAIQEAQMQRATTQRFVDTFARYYTPSVVILAILVILLGAAFGAGGLGRWVYEGLVILVIACPCALVISTPVTIVCGLTAGARRGILIKGGVHLENGRKLKAVAMDKTGTLTRGTPAVTDSALISQRERYDALLYAASIDEPSTHPIARAVVNFFHERRPNGSLIPVTDFRVLPGRGVTGKFDGGQWHLGNHPLMEELGICSPALESILRDIEGAGKTALVLSAPVGPIAVFGVADEVRRESKAALLGLKRLAVQSIMLTGDNWTTARAVAAEVVIDEVHAELLPEDKARIIGSLREQKGFIGMVGDGINDAPALARADIGFAMGAAGTATAIETADVAIMDDDLRKIPEFIRLSKRTASVLKQNITLALLIKFVFLALALSQRATLWMAIFADMGGSLLVVFNGMRILRGMKPGEGLK